MSQDQVKLCFTNVDDSSQSSMRYGIAIPMDALMLVPTIRNMITGPMSEADRVAQGKSVKISQKTTKSAVKEYFSWLCKSYTTFTIVQEGEITQLSSDHHIVIHEKYITNVPIGPQDYVSPDGKVRIGFKADNYIGHLGSYDAAILADFFGDEKFLDIMTPPPIEKLDRDLSELPYQISMFYVNDYLNVCFDLSKKVPFMGKLRTFTNMNPDVAKYIWDFCPREELLQAVNVPKRRRGRLMKSSFEDIPDYLTLLCKQNNYESDPELDRKIAEYNSVFGYWIDGLYGKIWVSNRYIDSDEATVRESAAIQRIAEIRREEQRRIHAKAKRPPMSAQLAKAMYGRM